VVNVPVSERVKGRCRMRTVGYRHSIPPLALRDLKGAVRKILWEAHRVRGLIALRSHSRVGNPSIRDIKPDRSSPFVMLQLSGTIGRIEVPGSLLFCNPTVLLPFGKPVGLSYLP